MLFRKFRIEYFLFSSFVCCCCCCRVIFVLWHSFLFCYSPLLYCLYSFLSLRFVRCVLLPSIHIKFYTPYYAAELHTSFIFRLFLSSSLLSHDMLFGVCFFFCSVSSFFLSHSLFVRLSFFFSTFPFVLFFLSSNTIYMLFLLCPVRFMLKQIMPIICIAKGTLRFFLFLSI